MRIVFQGEPGANSHIAVSEVFPDAEAVPMPTFEDCFSAVENGTAKYAMIPIENSVAGRVADIHALLPHANVFFVGEHFLPIRHQLMALPGVPIEEIRTVHSHVHALGQCRRRLRALGLEPVVASDTAGSARAVAQEGDRSKAAIASRMAAEIYGLEILESDIEDETHNTTRFVIVSAEPEPVPEGVDAMTSMIFRVRNTPASLYKALGGFATNGVNIVKLESYQLDGRFFATMFFADIEGHPREDNIALALDEVRYHTHELRIVGTYPASPFRKDVRLTN